MLAAMSVLEWIIVDEVHELLSSERGSQPDAMHGAVTAKHPIPSYQNWAVSYCRSPMKAGKFLVGTKRRCEIIRDTSVRRYDVEIMYVNGTITDVAQKTLSYVQSSKLDSPILLFTNTRGEAEFLASALKETSTIPVLLHHGSLSREVREETEQILCQGSCSIVVCTSSLELGLDIDTVELSFITAPQDRYQSSFSE